jgi:hypothetical protein
LIITAASYSTQVLCYLEGAWLVDDELTEAFESDRHFIDAATWYARIVGVFSFGLVWFGLV